MSRKQGHFYRLWKDEEQPPEVRAYAAYVGAWLRRIGRAGGLARAQRHSSEEISAWGRIRKVVSPPEAKKS
jgi:hypothetical protein